MVTTVAAGLRFAGIGGLSLSHFDEGSYISSAMTVATDGLYSFPFAQPLHSPPLWPWMIGGLLWITQAPWPFFGVLLGAALGSASVPLTFLVARRWGGNGFGLLAGTLLALSDFHAAYSRMALTDVPLTFWFLVTMYCVTRLKEELEVRNQATPEKKKGTDSRRVRDRASSRAWLGPALWTLATAMAAAAAWNTKYNGWLVLAIPMFTSVLWLGYQRIGLREKPAAPQSFSSDGKLMVCLLLATLIAGTSYVPWYLYVEHNFPGGYEAVTENHRRYFSGPAAWPAHALSLLGSLAALRHWGWILTLLLVVLGLGWRLLAPPQERTETRRAAHLVLTIGFVLGLGIVVLIQGGDAALLLLGAAGVIPALRAVSWERLLVAVWSGTFLVLTPFYHPYPRLLLPALPACICLALWLLNDYWPGLTEFSRSSGEARLGGRERARQRLAAGALAVAGVLSLFLLLSPHHFGLLAPTTGVWSRWTSHESYRAVRQAILQNSSDEAVVICQSQLVMVAYCPGQPVPVEEHSFATLLKGAPEDGECLLVVDFCWIHGESGKEALQGIRDHGRSLTPVAVIANDLNIVTLLDHLAPEQVEMKLAGPLPSYTLGDLGEEGHSLPVPPPISSPFRDTIVLYRVNLPLARPTP